MSDGSFNPEEPVFAVCDCACGATGCNHVVFAIRRGGERAEIRLSVERLASVIDCLEGYLRRARPRACRPRQEEQGERPS